LVLWTLQVFQGQSSANSVERLGQASQNKPADEKPDPTAVVGAVAGVAGHDADVHERWPKSRIALSALPQAIVRTADMRSTRTENVKISFRKSTLPKLKRTVVEWRAIGRTFEEASAHRSFSDFDKHWINDF